MSAMLQDVTFLEGGYCLQSGRMVGEPSWALRRFYATFVYFRHPVHGPALVDCGYGPQYLAATRCLPARLLRWTLPGTTVDRRDAETRWSERGIDRRQIATIFVTHFHGDHIGALRDFEGLPAKYVYRPSERQHLERLGYLAQLCSGYLSSLVPADLEDRGEAIEETAFAPGEGDLAGFRVVDYWHDGSLLLVDLPGHSFGHYGVLLRTADGPLFYVVDACWSVRAMLQGKRLPSPARQAQHSFEEYAKTQEKLRDLARRSDLPIVACHCKSTEARLSPRVGVPPIAAPGEAPR
ncbi:MAG TPA: MBL fold metallo-hydrolase [Pirellulaceae bacterium]|jgi:glyoxylase-like metal-dependent hydrolase (beta-lactamase superfamily II)|nr:MBL fold metallo-hydrolase [Pirellulaceae bacterium]